MSRRLLFPATPLARMTLRIYSAGFACYGLIMVLSSSRRWSAPQYHFMTDLAPQTGWGFLLITFGALGLLGSLLCRNWIRNLGLYGLAVYMATFAYSVLQAAVRTPTVSFGGALLFLIIAAAVVVVAQCDERRLA